MLLTVERWASTKHSRDRSRWIERSLFHSHLFLP
jgi:hypothetical protein